MKAYLIISTEFGAEAGVLKEMRKIKAVIESHALYGVYAMIVKLEFKYTSELVDLKRQIRSIENVASTLTLRIIEEVK